MKKILLLAGCVMGASALSGSIAQARPRGGDPMFQGGERGERGPRGGEGRGGGFRGSGGRAKERLNRLWRSLGELESGPDALSREQARRVVDLVLPWSTRPAMSDEQAHELSLQLENVLSQTQKAQVRPPSRGEHGRRGGERERERGRAGEREQEENFGSPPPRGGDGQRRDDGPDGPRGGRPPRGEEQDGPGARLQSLNPFFAPTGNANWATLPSSVQQDRVRRYREARRVLESLSRRAKN